MVWIKMSPETQMFEYFGPIYWLYVVRFGNSLTIGSISLRVLDYEVSKPFPFESILFDSL